MNWKIRSLFFLVVFSILSFAVSADYSRPLGDGCVSGEYYVGCSGGCSFSCEGEVLVKTCTQAHGWCFVDPGDENEGCYACDFVNDVSDECARIDCNGLDSSVAGSEFCDGSGDLWMSFDDYSCDSNVCQCFLDSKSANWIAPNSAECCPVSGDDQIGEVDFNAGSPNNVVQRVSIPAKFHDSIDQGLVSVKVPFRFLSSSTSNFPVVMKIYALDSADNELGILYSIKRETPTPSTITFFPRRLPSRTRKIKVYVYGYGSGSDGATQPGLDSEVILTCSCDEEHWVFDRDGDGYYSYHFFTPLGTGCIPPFERDEICDTFATADDRDDCREVYYWYTIGSNQVSELPENECVGSDYTNSICKDADNDALSTPDTVYCLDNDGDGFGSDCKIKSQVDIAEVRAGTRLPESDLLGVDCSGFDDPLVVASDLINPGTTWYKNSDGDNYWGDKVIGCRPGDDWVYSEPSGGYDCDDSTGSITFPEGCFCTTEEVGSTINDGGNNFVCYDITETSRTQVGLPAVFSIQKTFASTQWIASFPKTSVSGDVVSCPANTCALKDGTASFCAEAGTFWSTEGPETFGDHFCVLGKEGNAYWSSRTGKINEILVAIGERIDGEAGVEGYSVYCDSFDRIAGTFDTLTADYSPQGDAIQLLNDYAEFSSDVLGEACILVVDDGYSTQIEHDGSASEGVLPLGGSQRVILGFPTIIEPLNREYFGLDFNSPDTSNDGWEVQNNLYYYRPLKMLFVIQDDSSVTDLNAIFEEIAFPNSWDVNFFSFLRNPVQHVEKIISDNPATLSNYGNYFDNSLLSRFDRSFVGKENNFYFYSVLAENGKLIAKVVNPENSVDSDFNSFVAQVCDGSNEFYGVDFACVSEGGGSSADVSTLMDDSIISFSADVPVAVRADVWTSFSRQLRLRGNDGSGASLFDVECTQTDVEAGNLNTVCNPPTCFNATGCNALGLCEFEPVTWADGGSDGCCPQGITRELDGDLNCPEIPSVLSLDSKIGLDCNPALGEFDLLAISGLENGHASWIGMNNPAFVDQKVCLIPGEGVLFTEISPTSCNSGFFPVIDLIEPYNSHISAHSQSSNGLVCLKHEIDSNPGYNINCKVGTIDECAGYRRIISLTELVNAHVGGPDVYELNLCCKFYET